MTCEMCGGIFSVSLLFDDELLLVGVCGGALISEPPCDGFFCANCLRTYRA
jgi:hypothetical protein